MVEAVPENIEFAKEEQRIFESWEKNDTFRKCLKQSANKPKYSFYDGPPFATGLPHYGHLLTGTIKDIVTRWAHQSGFHVERRFGWDTHGLPIEFEIDKSLNIQGPDDVAKIGIAAYNAECRKIVMRYAEEWRRVVHRMGRWIDFDNDYKTMYPTFMESVWWVFKQLFDKDLVYRGVKVMPYSTKCNTPLSNFESGQNYKEVTDPAVIVTFPLVNEPEVSLVAWTTTPWTLPSNLALCVNPKSTYVKIKCVKTGKFYIVMELRLSALFKKAADYEIVDKFAGTTLKGKCYQPLFDYFVEKMAPRGAFQVLTDDYVSEEGGVGIVHQAPFFGEDDYRVCLANGVISKDGDIVCPVDPSGCFTSEVTHFAGQYVKDADKEIVKHLKNNGRLFSAGSVQHNYPFCWRSDTPLIYRAVPSWFVRVEQMSGKLLENNQKTYWVPDFVKEKRFGNWLRDARDWAISRNRYWGTPIPLWLSDDGQEVVCVGSIEELHQLSGIKVADLHRETIDSIEIPSKQGKGMLKRVPEVFDCWFESGSMPYAQNHYPFENKDTFEQNFPADFIAEGIDQTRGWFYTLLVISTALFDKAPFKNLIANGLVLASDGQKMSKRKKNYPDPLEVVNKYGADALRLYLINSPVVRAENLRFREEGVRDVLKECFLPWYNAYRFLIQNVQLYIKNKNVPTLQFEFANEIKSDNLMDRWILSATQSLILFVKKEMAAYRLYTVTPRLVKFIDNLTNWYVRMNRRRLKGENGESDWLNSLETLAHVLISMCILMAPFTPFLTDFIFQNLKKLYKDRLQEESVHMIMLPEVREKFIDQQVEQRVGYMQTIVEIGRIVRDRRTLPLKYPLPGIIVICKEQSVLDEVKILEQYILDELNVRQLILTTEKERYGVTLKAEPNIKALGLRLRNKSKEVVAAIRNWNESNIQSYQDDPTKFEINGEHLQAGEVNISYKFAEQSAEQSARYEAHGEGVFLVLLDTQADEQMLEEGVAREVINRIQKLRKKAQLTPTDPIQVYFNVPNETDLNNVIKARFQYIESNIKVPFLRYPLPEGVSPLISESQDLKETILEMSILKISGDQN